VIFRGGTLFFLCISAFALYERKNRHKDKIGSTMLPQAIKAFVSGNTYDMLR
jgi:hypothetical protein